MNVCMVAYTFYESDNRVRRYAETLASRGDNVDIVALRRSGEEKKANLNGINIYKIQEREIDEKRKLTYLYRLMKFFIKSFLFITRMHFKKTIILSTFILFRTLKYLLR